MIFVLKEERYEPKKINYSLQLGVLIVVAADFSMTRGKCIGCMRRIKNMNVILVFSAGSSRDPLSPVRDFKNPLGMLAGLRGFKIPSGIRGIWGRKNPNNLYQL